MQDSPFFLAFVLFVVLYAEFLKNIKERPIVGVLFLGFGVSNKPLSGKFLVADASQNIVCSVCVATAKPPWNQVGGAVKLVAET